MQLFLRSKNNEIQIPQKALDRFKKMGEALFYLLNDEEELISIGDNDEGQIVYPYFDKKFSLKNSLLKDVLILTGKNYF